MGFSKLSTLPDRQTQRDSERDFTAYSKSRGCHAELRAVPVMHSSLKLAHKKMRLQVHPPSAGLSQEHSACADGLNLT